MKRKLKLTITKVYRQTNQYSNAEFCSVCGQETEILNLVEVASLLKIGIDNGLLTMV